MYKKHGMNRAKAVVTKILKGFGRGFNQQQQITNCLLT